MKTMLLRTEWILWLLVAAPTCYMLLNWSLVNDTVILRYGIDGKPDKWGSKNVLLWFIPLVSFLTYLFLLFIPVIDPRKRVQAMGKKYYFLRLVLLSVLTIILLLYIRSSIGPGLNFTDYLFPVLAVSFIVLGNYLQSVKPNYFIGIRTPWALHDDKNWLKTHRFGSRLYIAGGVILLTGIYFFGKKIAVFYFSAVALLLFIPVVYSYIIYRKNKNR